MHIRVFPVGLLRPFNNLMTLYKTKTRYLVPHACFLIASSAAILSSTVHSEKAAWCKAFTNLWETQLLKVYFMLLEIRS